MMERDPEIDAIIARHEAGEQLSTGEIDLLVERAVQARALLI